MQDHNRITNPEQIQAIAQPNFTSEITPEERQKIESFKPSEALLKKTRNLLIIICAKILMSPPEPEVVLQAAKILGALGEERLPKTLDGGYAWLLTEAYLACQKDPTTIFNGQLMALLNHPTAGNEELPQMSDRERFMMRTASQAKEKKRSHGSLQRYVDLIISSKVGLRGGYSPEHVHFSLINDKGVDLIIDPSLERGDVRLIYRSKYGSVVNQTFVTNPHSALRLIKEYSET